MNPKTLALASILAASLAGGAHAQSAAPGSAEGIMNNPGSVKGTSNGAMQGRDVTGSTGGVGATGTSTTTGAMRGPSPGTNATGAGSTGTGAGGPATDR